MNDEAFMRLALASAAQVQGTTAPNPPVGAIVVRDGQVLGVGATRPVGGPHAEAEALASARANGHDPRGATLYVTLEPCCHHGRTPPCTDAILAAGIARVVVGCVDPFPPMRGKSLGLLQAAGVSVTLGVLGDASARSMLGFRRAVTTGLPEVTLKAAVSLDGRIATGTGESKWITGEAARVDAHALRARHDAVLVGIGTLLADDPRLTVRRDGELAQPRPVVLDTGLRIPAGAAVLRHPRGALVIAAEDAPDRELPATILRVPRGASGHLDLEAALRGMAAAGLHRVLVEGGGIVHRAFIDARLFDALVIYLAAKLIPGGIPWVGGPALEALAGAPRAEGAPGVQLVGDDVRLDYRFTHRDGPVLPSTNL